jgi:hypothetical protein
LNRSITRLEGFVLDLDGSRAIGGGVALFGQDAATSCDW